MNTSGNERELVVSNNYATDEQIARMGWHPITQVPAIFFAKVGAAVMLNRKRLVNEPFLLDNNTMAFSMDTGLLESEFGQSLFERLDLTSLVQVGALPSYNASDVEDITVALPTSMNEQEQIGRVFTQLDNLITLHQRKGIAQLSNSHAWEQRKLGELGTFGGGHTPSMADESNYSDGEILWVTSQDVKVDYLSDTTTKLSEKGASGLKLYHAGTLLMVTRSGILRHSLPVAMLRKPSTVNQDIRTISTNEDCSSLWLMQHLKAHSKALLLEYGKTGTTVESIDFAKMKSMAIMLPTPDEQRAIGGFFYQLDNLITLHLRELPFPLTLSSLHKAC